MQVDSIHLRRRLRCHVCGFAEVRTDEVCDRELVFLAECPRCRHRWTSSDPLVSEPVRARARPPLRREVPTAA